MKTISGLAQHLAGEVTTLATCWKITRRNGIVLGFTDHVRDLVVDGVTYAAASGYTRTAIRSTADLAIDNLDVESVFSDNGITEEDLRTGKYDFAEMRVFLVNYEDLAQGNAVSTPNLAIPHILQSQAQKEVTANEAFDRLDEAVNDLTTIDVSGGNTTIPAEDFRRNVVLVLTGPRPLRSMLPCRPASACSSSGTTAASTWRSPRAPASRSS